MGHSFTSRNAMQTTHYVRYVVTVYSNPNMKIRPYVVSSRSTNTGRVKLDDQSIGNRVAGR